MNMEVKELPVKYLGVPLVSCILKNLVIVLSFTKKILKKIPCWHAILSYAGRLQLNIIVLANNTYWNRTFMKAMEDIDATMCTFLQPGGKSHVPLWPHVVLDEFIFTRKKKAWDSFSFKKHSLSNNLNIWVCRNIFMEYNTSTRQR